MHSSPYLGDQVSVFKILSDWAAHLHPKALGSILDAFCSSESCAGGILTHLHIGGIVLLVITNVLCRRGYGLA
jgi:hypothetical protein